MEFHVSDLCGVRQATDVIVSVLNESSNARAFWVTCNSPSWLVTIRFMDRWLDAELNQHQKEVSFSESWILKHFWEKRFQSSPLAHSDWYQSGANVKWVDNISTRPGCNPYLGVIWRLGPTLGCRCLGIIQITEWVMHGAYLCEITSHRIFVLGEFTFRLSLKISEWHIPHS